MFCTEQLQHEMWVCPNVIQGPCTMIDATYNSFWLHTHCRYVGDDMHIRLVIATGTANGINRKIDPVPWFFARHAAIKQDKYFIVDHLFYYFSFYYFFYSLQGNTVV